MARPRSEDKQNAILEAAIRVIGTHGLSAPTAMIPEQPRPLSHAAATDQRSQRGYRFTLLYGESREPVPRIRFHFHL